MKKLIVTLLVSSVLCMFVIGCEPEDVAGIVTDINVSLSDPNGTIQETAEKIRELTDMGAVLVKAIPGFPYGKELLAVLAVIQTIIAIILGWGKHKTTNALKEVVWGGEILKKGPIDSDAFKTAQNTAQSESTVELVNKIRTKIA